MLAVGTAAPDFTLRDQNQQSVTLSDFGAGRADKNVLLVFFPLAFTGICQGELDLLRDHLPVFENDDSAALAISVGPPPTHKIWATQSGFLFPVLSDFWPHGEVAKAYDVFFDKAGMALRGTFLIDAEGKVAFAEVNQPGDAREQSGWKDAVAQLA